MTPALMALSGVGTFLLGLIFFYFPWQSFVVDQTRQRLFECRDHWFDYSQTLISKNDRARAAVIRAELNYMIRMLHEFTVPVLAYCALLHALWGHKLKDNGTQLDRLTDGFDSHQVRNEARKVVANAILQIAFCMWRRSILAIFLVPILLVGFVLLSATLGSAKSLRISLEKSVANLAVRENRQILPR